MPNSTYVKLACPVCKGDHLLEFACKFGEMEIYGCRNCGSTLSVPPKPERRSTPRV